MSGFAILENMDYNTRDENDREIKVDLGQDMHAELSSVRNDRKTEIVLEQERNIDLNDIDVSSEKTMQYYPTVPLEIKLCVGMEFQSDSIAYDFYNTYARASGFSIRRDRSWFQKNGVGHREFVCSKEGYRKCSEGDDNKMKKRAITRCGCKAMVEFKIKDGIYQVNKFVEGHNHVLHTPSKSHLLRSAKNLSAIAKSKNGNLSASGVRPTQCYNVMATEAGDFDKLNYTEENVREYIKQIARKTYGNDANAMLDYFRNKQEENPSFFYSVQVDETGQLCNCFWVDAKARLDYHVFGDVVSFDTTYKKNKYLMPFAPFTGINNHYQSIVFGCALLVDETEGSFIWLFKEWLRAVGSRPPTSIITDQDPAMKAAIAKVFPNTIHRFCMWHILQKVPEKLGHIYREFSNFKEAWEKCIFRTSSPDEFEEYWSNMIQEFNLSRIDWLQTMWDIRHMWMPVYLQNVFLAGISTTQRSESMNDFFKDWVNVNTSLTEFVRKYDMALLRWRELEKRLDFNTTDAKPILLAHSLMEKQLAEVLTKKMFGKFQEELLTIGGCSVKSVQHDDMVKEYIISHDFIKKDYIVSYVESELTIECTCHKFVSEGIVCRHMFFVFRLENILELPSRYILRRWRKDARSMHLHVDHAIGLQVDAHSSVSDRYNDLMSLANKCVIDGAMYQRSYDIMKETLTNAILLIQKINEEEEMLETKRKELGVREIIDNVTTGIDITTNQIYGGNQSQQFVTSQCGSSNMITVLDPKIDRAKGTGKRIGRVYRSCQGTDHDSCSCPRNKKQRT